MKWVVLVKTKSRRVSHSLPMCQSPSFARWLRGVWIREWPWVCLFTLCACVWDYSFCTFVLPWGFSVVNIWVANNPLNHRTQSCCGEQQNSRLKITVQHIYNILWNFYLYWRTSVMCITMNISNESMSYTSIGIKSCDLTNNWLADLLIDRLID